LNMSLSVGNTIDVGVKRAKKLGMNASISYRNSHQFYDNGVTGRYLLTGDAASSSQLIKQSEFSDSRSDQSTLWGAMFNTGLKVDKDNSLGLLVLHNQSGTTTSRYQIGQIPEVDISLVKEQRAIRFVQRGLSVAQLKGLHTVNTSGAEVSWLVSSAYSTQETPDMRTFDNDYTVNPDGTRTYHIDEASYSAPNSYFRSMSEVNLDAKVDLKLPLKWGCDTTESFFKAGIENIIKTRDFSERRFEFARQGAQFSGDLSAYFADSNMDANSDAFIYVEDLTDLRNTYDAKERVTSVYSMIDYWPKKRLRFVGGLRAELSEIQATSLKYFQIVDEVERAKYRGGLNNLDFLPSVNLTYKSGEKTQWRVAYSRTLARPTFRELAPFASFDFTTRYTKIGNPDLERTLVNNVDFRFEMFPRLGELLSFSAFYKAFSNPIELVINPQASNVELTWQNQERAEVYGLEIEFRKSLGSLSEALDDFQLGVNGTLVRSQTTINPEELEEIKALDPQQNATRAMFGQAPYIINGFILFKNETSGWGANMVYNVSGPSLALVVGGGTPDVYQQPKPTLDMNVSKVIRYNILATVRVKNILNAVDSQTYEFKEQSYTFQRLEIGRFISLGLSCKF
jgi:TonB-dependent receptor